MTYKICRVELRDKNFDLVQILTPYIKKPSWKYNRIGGCGDCTLELALAELNEIGPDYDVQIYLPNLDPNLSPVLRYRGYVDGEKPLQDKNKSSLTLNISGYYSQLHRIRVNRTYNNQEVSGIIKDILDQDVVPQTKIIYDAEDIEVSDFVVDTLEFDTMADDALETLANLAGAVEWGVDRDRKFFLKKSDNTIKHYVRYKIDINKYLRNNAYAEIINQYVIKGGKVDGVSFEDTVNNTESQNAYHLRTDIKSKSSIVTNTVSQRYGSMLLAESARIQRRAPIKLSNSTKFFEETVPMGRISVLTGTIASAKKYGDADAIYGSFKYGGLPSFQINSINYTVGDEGLDIDIDAGTSKPDIASQLKRLEFELDQLRNN